MLLVTSLTQKIIFFLQRGVIKRIWMRPKLFKSHIYSTSPWRRDGEGPVPSAVINQLRHRFDCSLFSVFCNNEYLLWNEIDNFIIMSNLFIHGRHNSKTSRQILMKFSQNVRPGTRKKWLDFGIDLTHWILDFFNIWFATLQEGYILLFTFVIQHTHTAPEKYLTWLFEKYVVICQVYKRSKKSQPKKQKDPTHLVNLCLENHEW